MSLPEERYEPLGGGLRDLGPGTEPHGPERTLSEDALEGAHTVLGAGQVDDVDA